MLSSRFLSQDEGPEFIPTLVKNKQRESLTSSPGSLPLRTSLPRSPPRSVADQFVLPPAHTRTTSLSGGSPRPLVAQAMSRAVSTSGGGAGSASGLSDTSSVKHGPPSTASREDLAARLRKESFGIGRAVRVMVSCHVLHYSCSVRILRVPYPYVVPFRSSRSNQAPCRRALRLSTLSHRRSASNPR